MRIVHDQQGTLLLRTEPTSAIAEALIRAEAAIVANDVEDTEAVWREATQAIVAVRDGQDASFGALSFRF